MSAVLNERPIQLGHELVVQIFRLHLGLPSLEKGERS
jgi:hypothetical protein